MGADGEWSDVKVRKVAKRRIERDLIEANEACNTASSALAELSRAWPIAAAGISLTETSTPAQVEAALAVWNSVVVPKVSYEREGRSVEGMEADLQTFDADVFSVVDLVAPELKSASSQESLTRLAAALAEMRTARDTRSRFQAAT